LAVASAVCGLTGFVPIIGQVLGVVFGVLSLIRIRRSRATGSALGGAPWAVVGLVSSGAAMLGWIALFLAVSTVSSSLGSTSNLLDTLTRTVQP
jgi:hypothetical protein